MPTTDRVNIRTLNIAGCQIEGAVFMRAHLLPLWLKLDAHVSIFYGFSHFEQLQ
jgi:hypothetical protein